jgi:protein-export membrane protein SecD
MKGKSFTLLAVIIILISMLSTAAINGLNLGGMNIKSVSDGMKLGLDIEGGVAVVFEAETDQTGDELEKTINQTISVLTRRINVLGLTEPNISKQGTNRIRVELPGVANAEEAIEMIGTTAQLNFMLVENGSFAQQGMTTADFKGEVILNGEDVNGAELGADQYNKPAVLLKFNSSGVDKFADATRRAAQYRGQIAIVLDGKVISAPSVNEQITKGTAIITGNFTEEAADNLAKLIRGGALPVNLKEVQTTVIGPTLGRDALNSSINAAKIGLILVCIFMIGYYRVPGLASVISLILYASLVSFFMVFVIASLTLPGI